jgi:DNA-binding phage protein
MIMAETFSTFNPSEYLINTEECKVFLADAFETGDAEFIISALQIVAGSQALTATLPMTAEWSENAEESSSPSLRQTLTLMAAIGLSLTVTADDKA